MMFKKLIVFISLIAIVLGDSQYCEAPYPAAIPPDPPTSTLIQAFVISRHGDRSPLHVLPGEFNDKRIYWNCSLPVPVRSLASNIIDYSATGAYFVYAENGAGMFNDKTGFNGNCQDGQLTRLGGEMCTRMGAGLREIYVDKYHLLPETITPETVNDVLFMRTTDVQRTRESLLSMLEGLYPIDTRKGVQIPVKVFSEAAEYISPNGGACPRITQLMLQNIVQNPTWMEKYNEVKDVVDQINTIAGTKGDPGYDNGYSVLTWADLFHARQCHNMPYPCTPDGKTCITDEMVKTITTLGEWQGIEAYKGEEVARLGSAPIFSDILDFFSSRISTGKGPKYIHYSAHDVSLFAMISGLVNSTPVLPYASSFRFELWQTSDGDTPKYGVQMVHDNQIIRPEECDADICPFDTFQNIINTRLSIKDVKKECAPQLR